MDDREGVRVVRNKGFRVIGTLRVHQLAAHRGLLDLADSTIYASLDGHAKTRQRREKVDANDWIFIASITSHRAALETMLRARNLRR